MSVKKRISVSTGFSLIELMVSLAIMSFLLVLSVPSFSAWMAQMRVRNLSEGIQFGVLQARAEAIKRNHPVMFELSSDTSWVVRVEGTNEILNKKVAEESSNSTTSLLMAPVGATKVTFNGFGQLISNIDTTTELRSVDVLSTKTSEGVKNLRVKIGGGGTVFVCDPLIVSVDDYRFCRGA